MQQIMIFLSLCTTSSLATNRAQFSAVLCNKPIIDGHIAVQAMTHALCLQQDQLLLLRPCNTLKTSQKGKAAAIAAGNLVLLREK